MASILIPKGSNTGGAVQAIGGVISMIPTPWTKAIGGAMSAVGGMASAANEKKSQQLQEGLSQSPENAKTAEAPEAPQNALERRAQKIEEDPYESVRKARMAIENAPKDLQEAYKDQLDEAMRIAQMQRTMA